jgi:predicted DNA-binding transcriptional regulator AlpA
LAAERLASRLLEWVRGKAKGASMAKRVRAKSPAKRNQKRAAKPAIDPRQMGLFDALEAAPVAPTRTTRARSAKGRPQRSEAVERPVVLNPREAAQYLGVSVSTLKNWRAKNIGPRSIKRGARLVAYRPADLEKFLDDNSARR